MSVIVKRDGIQENVLECIGSTPLVRVNNIIKGLSDIFPVIKLLKYSKFESI